MNTRVKITFHMFVLFAWVGYMHGFTLNLPDDVCGAHEIVKGKTECSRQIEVKSQNPIFLILVHGTFSSSKSFLDEIIINTRNVPEGLFDDESYAGGEPIHLAFNWSGELSDNARQSAGTALAHALDEIYAACQQEDAKPAFILVAHSHGGNVVAIASNKIKDPIDHAIFLGTPVLRHDARAQKGTSFDLYLPKKIKNLFVFYSMNDFVQAIGAAKQSFKRRYGPIKGINLYNIRLLLDGQEPLHTKLYDQLIEDNVLQLCANIKQLYKKNKNLIANIAPKNDTVDKLVAIKQYTPKKYDTITGVSVDNLWPNWESFSYTKDEYDEAEMSSKACQDFNDFYKKEFTETLPLLERTLNASQDVLCDRAVGKMGRGLAALPEAQREPLAKVCCPLSSFKRNHSNAWEALQCSSRPEKKEAVTRADMCVSVVGTPGAFLGLLPDKTKAFFKTYCCDAEFSQRQPRAAQALGC